MFALCLLIEKKVMTYSDPMVTHNYLNVTYSYLRMTYSDPKVTYSDPTLSPYLHLPHLSPIWPLVE